MPVNGDVVPGCPSRDGSMEVSASVPSRLIGDTGCTGVAVGATTWSTGGTGVGAGTGTGIFSRAVTTCSISRLMHSATLVAWSLVFSAHFTTVSRPSRAFSADSPSHPLEEAKIALMSWSLTSASVVPSVVQLSLTVAALVRSTPVCTMS
jgi:hypothetical protein